MKQFPIIEVVGPRQSGKTTLLKHAFPKYNYISLDDLDLREYALQDPRGFLSQYSHKTIFDEIQKAPSLFSYLQSIVDNQKQHGQFILSGSQNFLLMENINQTLAGRIALLQLLPFTLSELLKANQIINSWEKITLKGFYPRIYESHIDPEDWYPNYIQTYIERDVRQIKNVHDLATFQKFIKMCASRTGQLLNLSSLALDCGITHNTAKSWLSLLEASFILFLLQPYHNNIGKRLVKMPKLYFYDTGLLCALLGITTEEQLTTHYLKGGIFETLVISELLKKRFNQGKVSNLYFWRDKVGHEIDCLAVEAGQLTAIEIKAGKTVNPDFFEGIDYFQGLNHYKIKNAYIIYGGDKMQLRKNVKVSSWFQLPELEI